MFHRKQYNMYAYYILLYIYIYNVYMISVSCWVVLDQAAAQAPQQTFQRPRPPAPGWEPNKAELGGARNMICTDA